MTDSATMCSDREPRGLHDCHTAVNLSSPESAYSTGYSTDGASPGGLGPPEYYINIRTGKHYFPSPAPTPTSPLPGTPFTQLQTSFLSNPPLVPPLPALPPPPLPSLSAFSSSVPNHFDIFNFSKSPSKKVPPKSPLSSLKLFLKSPKQDKVKCKPEVKKVAAVEGKNKKWYKQPFQKFGHRRTDSSDDSTLKSKAKESSAEKINIFMPKEIASSPRQRNRIRTNPWLRTEPLSSQNFHNLQLNFSPGLVRNRSCTNTPLQPRKSCEVTATSDSLHNSIHQMSIKYENSKEYLNNLEKAVSRHLGQKLLLDLSDHSEEDLTLNEMIGTFNESYVYEKETDILSDSDPTDCEDYATDSEANNGGDERDSHDDELDFIDNASVLEEDGRTKNMGRCSYHDIYSNKNSFLYRNRGLQLKNDVDSRKSFRKDQESKRKRSKEEKKRRSARRSVKSIESKDDMKKKLEQRVRAEESKVVLDENVSGLNLNRVLMQRMMSKSGSKSAEGTPVCLRRRRLMRELRETHIGGQGTSEVTTKSLMEKDLFLVDIEADKKYNELISEAESMLIGLETSPGGDNAKPTNPKLDLLISRDIDLCPTDKNIESVDIWRTTETMCSPQLLRNANGVARKSPKHLGLKLDETPRKLKSLDFTKDKKSLFKAKSSAHSPLDPLGPTFKNFSIFKEVKTPKNISSSSSDDSEPIKFKPFEFSNLEDKSSGPGSPLVPIAFQSVDLGKALSYCPQSEPVKRKIYSCSKTYDQLVRRFEHEAKPLPPQGERSLRRSATVKAPQKTPAPTPGRQPSDTAKFFLNPVYSPYQSPVTLRQNVFGKAPLLARTLSYEVEEPR